MTADYDGTLRMVQPSSHLGRRRDCRCHPPVAASAARQRTGVRQQVLLCRDRCRGYQPRHRSSGPRCVWLLQRSCSGSTRWPVRHRRWCSGLGRRRSRTKPPPSSSGRCRRRSNGGDFEPPVSSAVHRRTYAFGLAASTDVRVVLGHPGFVGVHLRDAAALDKDICGGGLIRHVPVERLADVLPFIDEGDQTLTHWGIDGDALREVATEAAPVDSTDWCRSARRWRSMSCGTASIWSTTCSAACACEDRERALQPMTLRIAPPALASADALSEIAGLLERVSPRDRPWEPDLEWQYLRNPSGLARYVNAYDAQGKLIAHYAVLPTPALAEPAVPLAGTYLSLNVVADPTATVPGLMTSPRRGHCTANCRRMAPYSWWELPTRTRSRASCASWVSSHWVACRSRRMRPGRGLSWRPRGR